MAKASPSSLSLMASQTLILQNPNFLVPLKPSTLSLSLSHSKNLRATKLPSLSLTNPKKSRIVALSSSSSSPTSVPNPPAESLLTGSTRTVTTLLAVTFTISRLFAQRIAEFALKLNCHRALLSSAGPLFFAAVRDKPSGLNTPLTVVAAGMSKWLDIYNGVLLLRVFLSWFPNIPWERQPLSAIRDLCDPYLNLFRNIIPPLFDTLDISPLFAFTVLGFISSIVDSSRNVV